MLIGLPGAAHYPPGAGKAAGRVYRRRIASRPEVGELACRVAQRVEQFKLCPVVIGDCREVFVEGQLQKLQGIRRLPVGG